MRNIILCAAALLLATNIMAQKENFDLATFIAPSGWHRVDSNGVILFQNSKMSNGLSHFGQIFLFHSHAGSGNPTQDFNAEWHDRIERSTGTKTIPKTETEKTPEGWIQTTGSVILTEQGIFYRCTLVSLTGFGKQMSFVINMAGAEYIDDVLLFFKHLDMRAPVVTGDLNSQGNTAPESAQRQGGGDGKLSDYIYTAPMGWTFKQYIDGIVLSSPDHTANERCALSIWPLRTGTNNLWSDANSIFGEVFKAFQTRNDGMTPNSLIRGVAAQGWEYCMIKRSIGLPNSGTIFGFVFVAKLGSQVASISGMSKDPMVSNCFGLLQTDVWPKFFYSLQFRNYRPSSGGIIKQITGDWISATANAGSTFTFAPNGRYGDAAASQYYNRVSGTEVQQTTTAYFGNGTYTINGNQITLTSDSKKNYPEKGYIRVEQESIDDGRNWTEKLYLYRTSGVDGKEYELSYKRNR
jgi:hypothetical protein